MIEPHWQIHPGEGPYLLLVHGFLSSRAQWLLNLEALAAGCRPVTVELFGHHLSPSPKDPACYRPDYYLRSFESIREQLETERWFVLGYSLGAGLTLRYAFEHPDRLFGHLFTNSTSALADEERRAIFRASAREAARRIREGGIEAMERIPVHPKHGWRLPKPVYEALAADAGTHEPEGIAGTIGITNPEVSVRGRLAENTVPACLIWGTKERRFRPLAEHAIEHMPNLERVELDAGHGMNMECPEEFNKAVLEFISRWHTS
jgi:pimeloyl-ACP methyl ester carboxylesterase